MCDFTSEIVSWFRESDGEKKKEIENKLSNEVIPTHMKFFDDRLAGSGSGFIAESGFTWVDLYLYTTVDWNPKRETILANYKHIKEARDKIEAIPGIQNWLKVRPVTLK